MNYRSVFYVLGKIMNILGLLMLLPLFVSFYYNLQGFVEAEYSSFIIPIVLLICLGMVLKLAKPSCVKIYAREGLVICGIGWILVSLFGSLPFIISGTIPNFIDAFFETTSGFTTTGATVLSKIESIPKSILFWRSFTHWIGGMGILCFLIAVVPKSNSNSMYVMKAEVPGPKAGKVTPKISESARTLYIIYSVMTVIEALVLFVGSRITGENLRLFDSVVTAFATAGTGGFSVLNKSILGYNSKFVEWVCIIFMFLFGVNFNLYYFFITKRFKEVFKDEELRAYIIINVTFVAFITLNIMGTYSNIFDALRDSFFAVNTCMSTTGFCTADFDLWPTFSKAILILAMCIGCSAGSTGGGIKVSRMVLYAKQIARDIRLSTRPNTVIKVRMNKRVVDQKVINGVNVYLIIYVAVMAVSTLLLSIEGYSITTCFTAVAACFNNIGPGLELVGPTQNFEFLGGGAKFVLIIDMLAGRLELFPIIALLSPNTWRKAK